jgi:hypothetical protein
MSIFSSERERYIWNGRKGKAAMQELEGHGVFLRVHCVQNFLETMGLSCFDQMFKR